MHFQPHPAAMATVIEFEVDDYVLYRDPVKFWSGEAGHTVVCRVADIDRYTGGKIRYTLVPVTGGLVREALGDYMRLLPPVDAMRDIDAAPLEVDGAVDGMTAAAMAWLTRQYQTANRRPELPDLPPQRG